MKVSTKSWHYKHFISHYYRLPTSLCSYFWKLMFSLICLLIFIAAVIALFAVVFIAPFYGNFVGLQITSAIVLIISMAINYDKIKNKLLYKMPSDKPDNIVWAYIKAKKRKVCPLIEYTD